MNSGASASSLERRAMRGQSWSLMCPERMFCSDTVASAENSRIMISSLPISREKITVGLRVLDRRRPGEVQGQASTCRYPGRPATVIICPGCRPLVISSSWLEAGRDAGADAARGRDLVDLVQRRLQQRLDVDVVLVRAPLGDLVDLGLRAVDDVVDGADDVRRRPTPCRSPSARCGCRPSPAGAGWPARRRSARSSRRWPRSAPVEISVCRYGAPPTRASCPVRVSSADTVTASAGSPRPYRSRMAS